MIFVVKLARAATVLIVVKLRVSLVACVAAGCGFRTGCFTRW